MRPVPQKSDYIDIHSHHREVPEGVFRVYNLFLQDFQEETDHKAISLGLHPWHIENYGELEKLEENLDVAVRDENVVAVGECGLDKIIKIPVEKQKDIFIKQVRISEKHNLPVIVHCVKAYQELLEIPNETNANQPWILHGFNSSNQLAGDMIDKGIYISAGSRLLHSSKKCQEVLNFIPREFLFIETDDEEDIRKIYEKVAECMNISVDKLKEIVFTNYNKVFLK